MFVNQKKHDQVVQERDTLQTENATLTTERDTAIQERDNLQTQNDTLTQERDAAIQERDALQARLDGGEQSEDGAATQALNETFESLDELDPSVQNAETPEEKTTAVVSLVNTLRQSAGATPARLKSKTESKKVDKTEKDENVVSDSKSFMENLEAIENELL